MVRAFRSNFWCSIDAIRARTTHSAIRTRAARRPAGGHDTHNFLTTTMMPSHTTRLDVKNEGLSHTRTDSTRPLRPLPAASRPGRDIRVLLRTYLFGDHRFSRFYVPSVDESALGPLSFHVARRGSPQLAALTRFANSYFSANVCVSASNTQTTSAAPGAGSLPPGSRYSHPVRK